MSCTKLTFLIYGISKFAEATLCQEVWSTIKQCDEVCSWVTVIMSVPSLSFSDVYTTGKNHKAAAGTDNPTKSLSTLKLRIIILVLKTLL
jgi:hypothetical protein